MEQPIQETDVLSDDHDYRNLDLTEKNAFTYICGYLIRKCLKKHTCDTCTQFTNDNTELNLNNAYCFYRAYNSTEEKLFGNLIMPNNNFVQYMTILEKLFFEHIHDLITQKNIILNLLAKFIDITFDHPCKQFSKEYLLKLYSKVRLFYTLKFVNQRFKTQTGHRKTIILQHS